MTGDPFTGGNHEERDHTWSNLCPACKGYPQEHTRNEHCLVGPESFEIGGTVIQSVHDVALEALGIDKQAHEKAVSQRLKEGGFIPDIAGRDIRTSTSDPDCEED